MIDSERGVSGVTTGTMLLIGRVELKSVDIKNQGKENYYENL